MKPERLRELAARCRQLYPIANDKEIRDQLQSWAVEFEAEASKDQLADMDERL